MLDILLTFEDKPMLQFLLFVLSPLQQTPSAHGIDREQLQRGMATARHRALVVTNILDAVRKGDEAKLRSLDVLGVKYSSDLEGASRANGVRFTAASLRQFRECQAGRAGGSGINWVSVQWNCEPGLIKGSAATAFRFDGMRIVEIRTTVGAPSLRLQ